MTLSGKTERHAACPRCRPPRRVRPGAGCARRRGFSADREGACGIVAVARGCMRVAAFVVFLLVYAIVLALLRRWVCVTRIERRASCRPGDGRWRSAQEHGK